MKNLTLTQVSDVLSTVGYIIAMEGEDIAAQDLYEIVGDLEQSIAALLEKANDKSKVTNEQ